MLLWKRKDSLWKSNGGKNKEEKKEKKEEKQKSLENLKKKLKLSLLTKEKLENT